MIFEEMVGLALIGMISLALVIAVWPVRRPELRRQPVSVRRRDG